MCNKSFPKKLVVISPPQTQEGEREVAIELIRAGIDGFHIRKPGFTREQTEAYIGTYPERYRNALILHDHHSLADQYDLAGIHITGRHKGQGLENTYAHRQVSISVHSPDELLQLEQVYTYAFLSPVFDSISKKGYRAGFDLEELKNFFRQHRPKTPVVALGGIHPGNVNKLRSVGFDGIALLGAIWMEKASHRVSEVIKNFLKIKEAIHITDQKT